MASIAGLLERFDDDTTVHPGHMGLTTLGARARDESLPAGARGPVTASGQDGGPGRGPGEPRRAGGQRPQAPRGTYDVLPDQAAARAGLEAAARRILEPAGYGRIETPAFEATELFARGVGESTDIVQKEMYTFEDAGGRSLTLRPEGTAPVCRAYLEHGMHTLAQPVKLWYLSSYFRQEKPQAGRFRQFWQLGAEAIGSDDPAVDAEIDRAAAHAAGRARGPRACGCASARWARLDARAEYRERLTAYLRANAERLSADVRDRIDLNPLRAFDAKDRGTQEVMRDAPLLLDSLSAEDREHFDEVCDAPARRGHRLGARRHARARHRLLHAHDLRVHLRRAGRAVGRRRRRALRRPDRAARRPADARAWAGPRASSGCCSPPGSGPAPAPVTDLFVAHEDRGRGGLRAGRRGARAPGSRCSRSSPGARSRASSSRPIAPVPATLPSWAPTASGCATWTPASRRTWTPPRPRSPASSRDAIRDEAPSDAPTATATPGPAT